MAQELVFSNISNEIQLPSQECYKIHQDKQGYIWFSTDNGLCRYGNGSLKIFDKANGLPEESVYNISEDPSGRLWFATSDNRILYFDQEKLVEAPFNKLCNQPAVKEWAHPVPVHLDMADQENSFIANLYYSLRVNRSTNTVYLFPQPDSTTSIQFVKKNNHSFIPNQFRKTTNKYFVVQLKTETKSKHIILNDLPVDHVIHWNTPTAFSGNTDFIAIQNTLIKVNADLSHSLMHFPDRILNLYVDHSKGLWVGVLNNGVYYYPDVNTMKPAHHSLRAFSVTGICEDAEGGVWCTSLEKGIFYTPDKHLICYTAIPGLDRNMTLLKYTEGRLFASSSGTTLFEWQKQNYKTYTFPFSEISFSDILSQKDHWLLSGNMMIRTDKGFVIKEKLLQEPYHNVACNELAYGDSGRIYGVLRKDFMEIDQTRLIKRLYYNSAYVTKTMVHKSGHTFLLGGDQGLYEFNTVTYQSEKIKGVPGKIKKIIKSRSGRIWIATKNDGIYWLDDDKVTNTASILPLKTQLFHDLTEDSHGNIWAGSNHGLYCFSVKNGTWHTMLYSSSHGLPSNEVYKVCADRENIWFSTYEGLFSLPATIGSFSAPGPAIHLEKLSINNNPVYDSSHTFLLPYHHNGFRFTFDVLTFKNGRDTKLEYHLEHNGQTTITQLDGNELFLENLNPGTYSLTVYGITNSGVKSLFPEFFSITIKAPFWKTWWFILLISASVILLVLFMTRSIIRNIKRREEAKTQANKLLAEYQITALQAQMNPHFIFNAINTIQGYILEKNEEEAYNYLSKFGKLIRKVLHHSQQRMLTLDQELEVLNLYIELEQLRFDHCFDYDLKVWKGLTTEEIYLPGMILQPYVENAIWHGIINLRGSRRGKLEIIMERDHDLLIVTVKDNGIGRKIASGFNKDRSHKSVGMQLTKQRLDAMNQIHGYEMAHVTITDLFDVHEQPAGTSVEVRIPINTEL